MAVEEQSKLASIGSQLNGIVGPAIASAATITPTSKIHHVTGTTTITAITPPYTGFQGTLILIPDGVFAITPGATIGLGVTSTVVGRPLFLIYDGLKWYPTYVT